MTERWQLLDSQAMLLEQAAAAVEQARAAMQARTELAFRELAKIRAVDATGKAAKLVVDAGKLFLEVADAQTDDSRGSPRAE